MCDPVLCHSHWVCFMHLACYWRMTPLCHCLQLGHRTEILNQLYVMPSQRHGQSQGPCTRLVSTMAHPTLHPVPSGPVRLRMCHICSGIAYAWYACPQMQVRIKKHPTSSHLLRVAASAEASLIKTWSETGGLWGLLSRAELQSSICRRFDWFCGQSGAVVAAEKHRAAARFLACCVGACMAAMQAVHHGVVPDSTAAALVAAGTLVPACAGYLWLLEESMVNQLWPLHF